MSRWSRLPLTFALQQSWAYFRALYAQDYDMYSHLNGDGPVAFSDHQVEVMRSQIIDARHVERILGDQRARRAAVAMKAEAVEDLRLTRKEIINALNDAQRSMSCITGAPYLNTEN